MKTTFIFCISLFLISCGDNQSASSNSNQNSAESATVQSSRSSDLDKYLSEENICDVISKDEIQGMFLTTQEIETTASSFMKTYTCDYSWDRNDKEAREKQYLKSLSNKDMTMRQKVMSHSFSVSLSETKRTPQNFVPPKLTEKQLQAQIDRAKKAANEKLSQQQKDVAGDAANSMIQNMLKKNNQNQAIENVGDAAYWSKIGHGNLNVLTGDLHLVISPMIADTEKEDIDNAKKISMSLLK